MLVLVIGHVINLSFIDERKNIYYKRIQEGENPEYLKKHTVCTYIEYSVTCILLSIFFYGDFLKIIVYLKTSICSVYSAIHDLSQ